MAPLQDMVGDLRRVAIGALLVSLVAGVASGIMFLAAFQFRVDWFADPARLVTGGPTSAQLLRWGSILDVAGYYVATGVLAYALWRHLRPRNPTTADLSLLSALGYTLAGGAAASVLAMAGPLLMERYASAADPALVETQFAVLIEGVGRGVWQLFDGILLAAWWLGLGVLLRPDHRRLAGLSLVLAAAAAVGTVANAVGLGMARDASLLVVFALWAAWWVSLLWILIRRSGEPGDLGVSM